MKFNKDLIAILIAIIIGIFYYNVVFNSPVIFGDEGYYAAHARLISRTGYLPKFEEFHSTDIWHPKFVKQPLYILIEIIPWLLLGELGLKLIIPIFSLLSGIMIYLFLKKFKKENAGLVAEFLFLLTPGLVTYGVMNYTETSTILMFLLSIYFYFIGYEKNDKKIIFLSGIFAAMSMLDDITGIFSVGLITLYTIGYLFYKRKIDISKIKLFGIFVLVSLVFVSPLLIRTLLLWNGICYEPLIGINCSPITDINIPKLEGLKFESTVAPTGTGLPIIKLGLIPYFDFAFGLTITILLLMGIYSVFSKKEKINFILLLWFILFVLITIKVGFSGRSEDAVRYTLFGIPSIAMISGIFISEFYERIKKYSKILSIIIILVILFGAWYYGNEKLDTMFHVKQFSEGFKEGCNWLKYNTPNNSLIYVIYGHRAAYWADRKATAIPPDQAEIALTYNDTSYEHLKLNGYNYVMIEEFTISNHKYKAGNNINFVKYLETSPHFKKVFDNTNKYGQGGVRIYKIL